MAMAMAAQSWMTSSLENEPMVGLAGQASRTPQLWEEFFSNPLQWRDNWSDCKRNPKFLDFRHKTAKKALAFENRFNPRVHSRLAFEIQCKQEGQSGYLLSRHAGRVNRTEQLWKDFFTDPSQWWDNRFIKRSPKYPDFRHKSTHEGLWIEGWLNPSWVKAKMASMALDRIKSGGGLRSRLPNSYCNGDDVNKLCQEGRLKDALDMVELMVQQNTKAPIDAYVVLLKGCARRKALVEGKKVHALIVQSGRDSNIFLGKTLMDMYAKCSSMLDARKVFNTMPEHNVFSWTAIISAYVDHGQGEEAISLFHQMQQTGIAPDKVAFVVVLKACARIGALEQGKQLHSDIIKSGFESDVILGSAIVDMYAKCGCIDHALQAFTNMSERNVVSWSAMIAGYSKNGFGKEALELYEQMKQEGVQPNNITYVVLLNACARIAALEQGKQLHSDIIRSGFESDVIVGNTLVDMYAKCGCIEHARRAFNKMRERNVVSWSTMIAGYAHNGLGMEALALYEQMKQESVQPNNVTYAVLLKACASTAAMEQGKQLHADIVRSGFESDVVIGNTLVDMYAKCGCIGHARQVFDKICKRDVVSWNSMLAGYVKCGSVKHARQLFNKMSERNVVSWNSMMAGYAQNGLGKEALALYEQMKQEGVQANNVTYVILLKACASMAALEPGKRLHSDIIRNGIELDLIVGNTLVDMYAKCGCIEHARQVFNKMSERDVVSWTAMIAGSAQQGLGKEALTLLEQMQREGTKPDEVTYLSVLSACSHSGLVNEGRHLFDSMRKDHSVTPSMEHYACMVDLLGRAGCLADAEDFINKMPIQPDAVIWTTLLGAARNHKDMGRCAFDCVGKLET